MAVTGFWPIYKNLKATLDYADNPDKTTAREYLDDDLYAALSYAENDNKTDRKMYVGGINCSKQNAYVEMIAVQHQMCIRDRYCITELIFVHPLSSVYRHNRLAVPQHKDR